MTMGGAGPGWTFLSGRPAEVETLRRGLGFTSDDPAEDAGDPGEAPVWNCRLLLQGVD